MSNLVGYLDEVIKPLVLMLSKMRVFVQTFKDRNNKVMCLRIYDAKLLEK